MFLAGLSGRRKWRISSGEHSQYETNNEYYRTSPSCDLATVQDNRPECSNEQERLPWVVRGPCQDARKSIERKEEWVGVGERSSYLWRCRDEERGLFVNDDSRPLL